MKKILVIGGSHGITQALIKHQDVEWICLSRTRPDATDVQWIEGDILSDDINWPAFDEIHGLVYAPGSIQLRPFDRLSLEQFRQDFELNTLGAVKAIQATLPALKKGKASVVFYSTVAARKGMPFHASISSAKGALESLCISLASEYAPTIRFNTIALSLVDTPLAERLTSNPKMREQSEQKHPLKRIGNSKEVAALTSFLLSDDSSWMTGQILGLDGGLSTL